MQENVVSSLHHAGERTQSHPFKSGIESIYIVDSLLMLRSLASSIMLIPFPMLPLKTLQSLAQVHRSITDLAHLKA